jgi:transcriptional regulator with XRE-family HTH domain
MTEPPKTRPNATPEMVLRTIRLEQGIRQADLADILSRPQSFVSKYESLERRLSFEEVEAVCAALNIDLFRFVERLRRARQEAANAS